MDALIYEVREPARGLYDLVLLDTKTLRDFDFAQLPPLKAYSPDEIKQLRLRTCVSQAVFAAYLNTSVSTVRKWEIGDKKPRGAALRLLDIIDRKGLKALEAD
jgi:putative transcriptional regulator